MKCIFGTAIIISALALIMSASGSDGAGCSNWNFLTQTNELYADSGYYSEWHDTDKGDIYQEASNCAAVMGLGNTVLQKNDLNSYGILILQSSENALMVVGTKNDIKQTNTAVAEGTDPIYGSNIDQSQKNILLVLGHSNSADQSNDAKAHNEVEPDKGYYIVQTEKNIAALLGNKNDLDQTNTIEGYMRKFIEVDPILTQNAKNLAFMVGMGACYEGEECELHPIDYGIPNYEWPLISSEKVTLPEVTCEGCFELEGCE